MHDRQKMVTIELREERYSRLVMEVKDTPAAVEAIQERLGERRSTTAHPKVPFALRISARSTL